MQPAFSDFSAEYERLGGIWAFLAQHACSSLVLGDAGLGAGAVMTQPWLHNPTLQSMAESTEPDAPQIRRSAMLNCTTDLDASFRICLMITPAEVLGFPRFHGSMPNSDSCLRSPYLLP